METDWKKKYEEALERMKYVVVLPENNQALQALKETVFPELAESEDERIRKIITLALIASEDELSAFYSTHNITRRECTDWLEKQKEQKPAECGKTKINGRPISAENQSVNIPLAEWSEEDEIYLQDALWCVKQASKVARDENDMGACWSAERWLKSLPERFNLQLKQEWSEEDELMRTAVIQTLETFGGRGTTGMQIDWMKSLRPQPKQEWSKIDEQISNGLIKALENLSSDWLKLHGVIKSDAIAWLKCHHNHPSWKPSEEQEGPEYYQHFDPDC